MSQSQQPLGSGTSGEWVIHPAAIRRWADGSRKWGPRPKLRRASARQAHPRRSPKARFRIALRAFPKAAARQLPQPGRRPGFL